MDSQSLYKKKNKNEKEKNDYFSCLYSPFFWKLNNDPYKDVRNKHFKKLKRFYSTMIDYKNVCIFIIEIYINK